jgi:hypothetical protein
VIQMSRDPDGSIEDDYYVVKCRFDRSIVASNFPLTLLEIRAPNMANHIRSLWIFFL